MTCSEKMPLALAECRRKKKTIGEVSIRGEEGDALERMLDRKHGNLDFSIHRNSQDAGKTQLSYLNHIFSSELERLSSYPCMFPQHTIS